jgi:hypothetical protein
MEVHGHVKNGQVVIDSGGPLPEGARVRIRVEPTGEPTTLAEKLLRWAGKGVDLPADLAENHDHYLHGQPKR